MYYVVYYNEKDKRYEAWLVLSEYYYSAFEEVGYYPLYMIPENAFKVFIKRYADLVKESPTWGDQLYEIKRMPSDINQYGLVVPKEYDWFEILRNNIGSVIVVGKLHYMIGRRRGYYRIRYDRIYVVNKAMLNEATKRELKEFAEKMDIIFIPPILAKTLIKDIRSGNLIDEGDIIILTSH